MREIWTGDKNEGSTEYRPDTLSQERLMLMLMLTRIHDSMKFTMIMMLMLMKKL